MTNLLCEAEIANLSWRRALKAATTAIRIAIRITTIRIVVRLETYDWYVTKPNHTKPFFIRAIDPCAALGIELRKKDVMVRRQQSHWMTNVRHQIRDRKNKSRDTATD
jgi:hypothetical protein